MSEPKPLGDYFIRSIELATEMKLAVQDKKDLLANEPNLSSFDDRISVCRAKKYGISQKWIAHLDDYLRALLDISQSNIQALMRNLRTMENRYTTLGKWLTEHSITKDGEETTYWDEFVHDHPEASGWKC